MGDQHSQPLRVSSFDLVEIVIGPISISGRFEPAEFKLQVLDFGKDSLSVGLGDGLVRLQLETVRHKLTATLDDFGRLPSRDEKYQWR